MDCVREDKHLPGRTFPLDHPIDIVRLGVLAYVPESGLHHLCQGRLASQWDVDTKPVIHLPSTKRCAVSPIIVLSRAGCRVPRLTAFQQSNQIRDPMSVHPFGLASVCCNSAHQGSTSRSEGSSSTIESGMKCRRRHAVHASQVVQRLDQRSVHIPGAPGIPHTAGDVEAAKVHLADVPWVGVVFPLPHESFGLPARLVSQKSDPDVPSRPTISV